jgi:large subunit ribosomal protein L30
MTEINITWVKSAIGYKKDQKRTIKALGFHRLNESITHQDSAAIRGMINKVRHLVKVEEKKDEAG